MVLFSSGLPKNSGVLSYKRLKIVRADRTSDERCARLSLLGLLLEEIRGYCTDDDSNNGPGSRPNRREVVIHGLVEHEAHKRNESKRDKCRRPTRVVHCSCLPLKELPTLRHQVMTV